MTPHSGIKSAILIAFTISAEFALAAPYTTLSLPTLNHDMTDWTDGGVYNSLFPSNRTLADIPFQFEGTAESANAFIGPGSLDISVGVFGATNFYTLISSGWGSMGTSLGSISFYGSAGATYFVELVEGLNVRDHYLGDYVNTTTAPYVTEAVWGNSGSGAHLDMQNFVLPDTFRSQTLTNVVFNAVDNGAAGVPVLVAATVAAVPEPETAAMLMAGLGILGAFARRKNQSRR